MGFAAIVLAGGSARRMGGVHKPMLTVGGVPLLDRVLAAIEDAEPIVVVGPRHTATKRVRWTREEPVGGGPVAAIAAGFALVAGVEQVAVVAGDLPFLTVTALTTLRQVGRECAVYVDSEGRRQPMVAVWECAALAGALAQVPLEGSSMKLLLAAADVAQVPWTGAGPEPWYDCDTPEALKEAERWL